MQRLLLTLLIVFTTITTCAYAEEAPWPQFRGPGASGVANNSKPPVELGPDKNVKWKVAIPGGLSSPIVVGDKLILTTHEGEKLFTVAYSRANGRELWRAQAPAEQLEGYHKTDGSPAASTPVTDGTRIVSYFGSCGLICYDLNGKEQWKYSMPMAMTMGDFGTGTSPILVDGIVVVVRDEATDPKIVAIDAATGKLKWEKKRQSQSGYCTPAIWETASGKQIAAPGMGRMVGYDLKTGEEKWFVTGMPAATCASPMVFGGELYFAAWSPGDPADSEFKMPTFDELLKAEPGGDANKDGTLSKDEAKGGQMENFIDSNDQNKDGRLAREEWDSMIQFMAASKNSAFALRPGGTGDVSESHIRWKKTRGLPYVSSAIVYEGQLVMAKDGGILTAYDIKTGDELYQRRALPAGSYYSSPVAANGNIYFASLEDGAITVLKGGTKTPEVIAENSPLGERLSATPAIVGDTIYVRTAGHLYAFAAR